MFKRFPTLTREDGQGLVEYALILVLVAMVIIAVLLLLGPQVGSVFSSVVVQFQRVGGSGAISNVSLGGSDGHYTLTVTVSEPDTEVVPTVMAGSANVSPPSRTCNPDVACSFNVNADTAEGAIFVSSGGGGRSIDW